jgi:hypothetical protein
MQAVAILMPSGMISRPHECKTEEEAIAVAISFKSQMQGWHDFEAWLLLLEDDKEISRDHISTA